MEELDALLKRLLSPDLAARREAEADAARMPPESLPALAAEMSKAGGDPAVAKAAALAVESIVHRSLAPRENGRGPDGDARRRVLAGLLTVAQSRDYSRRARAHALRLLGIAGDGGTEKRLASLERDVQLGEDARMARERIRRVRF